MAFFRNKQKTIDPTFRIEVRKKRIYNDFKQVQVYQPELQFISDNKDYYEIVGNFKLLDENYEEQGNWNIRVVISHKYPKGFPILFETCNKIERIIDRHIDDDGKCCLESPITTEFYGNIGISLNEFFNLFVVKFFSWQLLYDSPFRENLKEWPHNDKWLKEFFFINLNTKDEFFVENVIHLLKNNLFIQSIDDCPCNSGRPYSCCHSHSIHKLRKLKVSEFLNKYNVNLNS